MSPFPLHALARPTAGKDRQASLRAAPALVRQEDSRLADLRRAICRLESGRTEDAASYLSLGIPEIHHHLPGPGLLCGALHEAVAATHGDVPASFGFVLALMAHALRARRGPAFLVVSRQAADFGNPYGHGLRHFDIDVGRLLLVQTSRDKDALWAMEEILRPGIGTAMVAGAFESSLDLTMSRRLNLAAATAGTPLLLMRPAAATGTSAAMTRWRIAAAPAGRDRFDAFASWRWQVTLERCRNGRTGEWKLEWNHVAHRFRLAEVLADRTFSAGAKPPDDRRVVRSR